MLPTMVTAANAPVHIRRLGIVHEPRAAPPAADGAAPRWMFRGGRSVAAPAPARGPLLREGSFDALVGLRRPRILNSEELGSVTDCGGVCMVRPDRDGIGFEPELITVTVYPFQNTFVRSIRR